MAARRAAGGSGHGPGGGGRGTAARGAPAAAAGRVASAAGSVSRKRLLLFSGSTHPDLARGIARHLGVEVSPCDISRFASGEIYVRPLVSVRGADVFVVQTHAHPVNESILELTILLDAMRRASARHVTAVIPYFGYSRQDKKTLPREPISAKLVANLIAVAGADRVVSVDLHSGQLQGYFDFPVDHLTALPILARHLSRDLGLEGRKVVVVAPDTGRVKTAEKLREALRADLAFLYKRRSVDRAHEIEEMAVVGQVAKRPCILVDDMIDTGGTIGKGAATLVENGAGPIYAAATHPVLSGGAVQRLEAAPLERVVVTDSMPIPPDRRFPRLTVLPIAPLVAEALRAVFEEASVSRLFPRGDG
jgi:ribose-phosphate pyrophosphokinase